MPWFARHERRGVRCPRGVRARLRLQRNPERRAFTRTGSGRCCRRARIVIIDRVHNQRCEPEHVREFPRETRNGNAAHRRRGRGVGHGRKLRHRHSPGVHPRGARRRASGSRRSAAARESDKGLCSYPCGVCFRGAFSAVDDYSLKVPGDWAVAVHVIDGLAASEKPAVVGSLNDDGVDPPPKKKRGRHRRRGLPARPGKPTSSRPGAKERRRRGDAHVLGPRRVGRAPHRL